VVNAHHSAVPVKTSSAAHSDCVRQCRPAAQQGHALRRVGHPRPTRQQTVAHLVLQQAGAFQQRCAHGTPNSIGARFSRSRNQPWKVVTVGPGIAVSTVPEARARGKSASISSSGTLRSLKNSRTVASSASASSRSHSCSRSVISCAALRVKVIASRLDGAAPASNRRIMRETSSQVLPLPAQASTTAEWRGRGLRQC